jgi:hypothetical protein
MISIKARFQPGNILWKDSYRLQGYTLHASEQDQAQL